MKQLTLIFIFSLATLTSWAQVPDSLASDSLLLEQLPSLDSLQLGAEDSLRALELADSLVEMAEPLVGPPPSALRQMQDTLPPDSSDLKTPFRESWFAKSIRPVGLRPGIDLVSLGQSIAFGRSHLELALEYDMERWIVALEGGYFLADRRSSSVQNYIYSTEGSYFRLGLDFNLLDSDPYETIIFIGMRFGYSSYSNSVQWTFINTGAFEGPVFYEAENPQLSSTWWGLAGGIKAQVLPNFFMGYTLRASFGLTLPDQPRLSVFDAPGFGNARDDIALSWSYNLYYRFGLRRSKAASRVIEQP